MIGEGLVMRRGEGWDVRRGGQVVVHVLISCCRCPSNTNTGTEMFVNDNN